MKRTVLILLVIAVAQAATIARAETTSYTVVLAGGASQSMIHIWLTPDGYSYVIDSVAPLEVGGSVCENAPGNPNELLCKAPMVAGFEVNAGPDDDSVAVARSVNVPVTIRGGPGRDTLLGGSGPDKLLGGEGDDRIVGHGGNDLIFGGPGADTIVGGSGNDVLRGGPGADTIEGGSGQNSIRQEMRRL
jgi:Ca2+-binding RTX toxin-like protein